jgi:type I restriction enzyme S subunit
LPEGQKSYSKTKVIQFDEFAPLIKWWPKRKETEQAWRVKVGDLKKGFDLDVKNPHSPVLENGCVVSAETNYEHSLQTVTRICQELATTLEPIGSKIGMIAKNPSALFCNPKELSLLQSHILSFAVDGRLTADWRAAHPDTEPASKLLTRIQAGKKRLVTATKIRPEKPFPEITLEEIPFTIPKSWEWCRLIELCEKTGSGSTPSGGKSAYSESGIPFLRSQNVHDDGLVLDGVAKISAAIHKHMEGTTVFPNDLLLNITGGSIGRCTVVSNEIKEANVNQHVAIIRPVLRTFGKFLHAVILSPYFQGKIEEAQTGAGREGLPKNKMDRFVIPLPPQAEQAEIVARVKTLLGSSRLLAAEIAHTRTHAAHLLQAVLKAAFTPAA